MADPAFAGFESKWAAALPEFALALRFLDAPGRRARSALACIGFEIEHAASHAGAVEVATGKLHWWLDEFGECAAGKPRHPLTRVLADEADLAGVPMALWHKAVNAALAVFDEAPAADFEALLEPHRVLHRPLAGVGFRLFGEGEVTTVGEFRALRRALRDALASRGEAGNRRLVVPLDLLARHRLGSADLAVASPSREILLADLAAHLAARLDALDHAALPLIDAAAFRAERWRCGRLAGAREPTKHAPMLFTRLPLSAAWHTWRAARRHRRA